MVHWWRLAFAGAEGTPLSRQTIDQLRDRAERTAARLFVLAGISTGLITAVAVLFLQDGRARAAVAVGLLGVVVGGFMIIAAQHIRFSALSLYEVGADLRAEATGIHRRQADTMERIAELRTRDFAVERALTDLRARVRELESRVDGPGPSVDARVPDSPADLTTDLTTDTAHTPPSSRPIPAGAAVTTDLPVTRVFDAEG